MSAEQTTSKSTCPEYTKESITLLAKFRELVMRIIYSIFILVVLETLSLIVKSLALGAVILPARVFEDNI